MGTGGGKGGPEKFWNELWLVIICFDSEILSRLLYKRINGSKRYFVRSKNTALLRLFAGSFSRGNYFSVISDFSFPGSYQFINF